MPTMSRFNLALAVVLAFGLAAAVAAADVFLDPEEAGPDFAIQGEYVGELQGENGRETWAAQVVALGDGRFLVKGLRGGLPGDGWDGSEPVTTEAATVDGRVRFEVLDGAAVATVRDESIEVRDAYDVELGRLEKTLRESPTLGKEPPEGAAVLFDGTTAEHFRGKGMTEEGLLREGQTSLPSFQDHKLHVEFMIPFMPFARGQGRGNSGVYLQGRYEVQVLDSFGLDGRDDECGGIYGVADPRVNMCFPPLSWQTFDVEFTAARFENGRKVEDARMTVWHNGVKVHDDVEVPHATTAHPVPEGPEPGPVYLQDHGSPVRFRNIWVMER